MHDLDRTQLEVDEWETDEYELESNGEFESDTSELLGELLGGELEAPIDEVEEMELASTLLEVSDEQELDQFLGKLISTATGAVKRFAATKEGTALKKHLAKAAVGAVPHVGAAIGRAFGDEKGAQWGKTIGGALGGGLGGWFDVELEGLSPEDKEFEISRKFVKFAVGAARNLLNQLARSQGPVRSPNAAAKAAVITAARKHAPGLTKIVASARPLGAPSPAIGTRPPALGSQGGPVTRGQWVRRGNTVILLGM